MTPLYTIVALPTVPPPDYHHVSATLYYCVVRGPQEFPSLPLNVAGFRVAEGAPGQYYKVPPTTPTGLWAGIQPLEYLGSRLPDDRFLTPEGAVLAYVEDLRSSQEEAEADIVALGHAIAAHQAQRSAKEATRGAITAALDSIMGQFRTIPQITRERVEELATRLQPVIAIAPPTYARSVTPNLHADFLHTSLLLRANDHDLTLSEYGTDIVYTHSPTGPSLAEVYACLDRDGRMPSTPAFFTVAPAPANDQRTRPDPHNPDGYYTRTIRLLREAP